MSALQTYGANYLLDALPISPHSPRRALHVYTVKFRWVLAPRQSALHLIRLHYLQTHGCMMFSAGYKPLPSLNHTDRAMLFFHAFYILKEQFLGY